jgi:hypothetical protein
MIEFIKKLFAKKPRTSKLNSVNIGDIYIIESDWVIYRPIKKKIEIVNITTDSTEVRSRYTIYNYKKSDFFVDSPTSYIRRNFKLLQKGGG